MRGHPLVVLRRRFLNLATPACVLLTVGGYGLAVQAASLMPAPAAAPIAPAAGDDPEYTDDFAVGECRFAAGGENRYFSLRPCYQLYLSGVEDGERIDLYITVLNETRDIRLVVDGREQTVRTRVIEEREFKDGALYEISRNYYARCRTTNDVYYFGEDVCFYEGDDCVSTGGSWLAGQNDATPGIIMPGTFLLGSRYFQEQAPGVAVDRAEHIDMGVRVRTPAGRLSNCVSVLETSALDPGAESVKVYAPGIGLVKDGPIRLVSFGFVDCASVGGPVDD